MLYPDFRKTFCGRLWLERSSKNKHKFSLSMHKLLSKNHKIFKTSTQRLNYQLQFILSLCNGRSYATIQKKKEKKKEKEYWILQDLLTRRFSTKLKVTRVKSYICECPFQQNFDAPSHLRDCSKVCTGISKFSQSNLMNFILQALSGFNLELL